MSLWDRPSWCPNAGDLISFEADMRFFCSEGKIWLDIDTGYDPWNPFQRKEVSLKAGQQVLCLGKADYTTYSILSEKFHTWTEMLWIMWFLPDGRPSPIAVMSFMIPYTKVISRIENLSQDDQ